MSAVSRISLLLAWSWLLLARAAVAGEVRNVLVLYSYGPLVPANIASDQGLRESISHPADRRVELYAEFLDSPHASGESYEDTFARYLSEKYSSRPPDAFVVMADEALGFLLRNRARLFPRAPVAHMGVSRAFLRSLPPLPADVIGVPMELDFSGTIEQALRWHPMARRLVVVTGTSSRDREWEARLRTEVPRLGARATIEFLPGLPTGAVLKRLGELDGSAVVFTPGYIQDGEGRQFTPRESAELMAAAAHAPVYGPFDTFLGAGVVGGRMPSFVSMGRQAAQILNALFDGAAPTSLRLPEITPAEVHVDWRQARRWGIAERSFPAGTVVHFREPAFWEAYRKQAIVAFLALLLQAGLIAALLFERREGRRTAAARAELENRARTAANAATEADDQLHEERAFLRQVIDINPNLIFAKDRQGRFTLVNQAVADLYGTTVKALIGKTDADFNSNPEEVELFRRADLEVMDTLKERFIPEERITDAAGKEHWLQTVKRPVLSHDGTAHQVLGTATDITRRKYAELELEQQRNELAHLSRVTLLGELSGSLAHELNQPLTAILSNAQAAQRFLASGPADLDEVRGILKDIVEQDKHAGEVIRRLRLLLKKGEVNLQPLDVSEVVQDVLKIMRSDLVNHGVAVRLELARDLPAVHADRVQMQQVLLNLVLNGCDAMAETAAAERRLLVRTGREDGGGVRVSVNDRGCGIPTGEAERIFEPFFTTKVHGMGLGLTVCRTILAAHGGRLWAEAGPGAGTTVQFTLPAGSRASP